MLESDLKPQQDLPEQDLPETVHGAVETDSTEQAMTQHQSVTQNQAITHENTSDIVNETDPIATELKGHQHPEVGATTATVKSQPSVVPVRPFPAFQPPRLSLSLKLLMRLTPLWIALLIVTPAGIGYLASNLLLKSPQLPNCPKIFWPIASASLRLQCADIAASKQTTENLLSAIQLVNELPKDHPLRPEINRRIQEWSDDILVLSEELFQAGDLKSAVANARKIPAGTPAHPKVEQRIQDWQGLWEEAEKIFKTAENLLRKEATSPAFRQATKLLEVGNQYWETAQYRKLTDAVQITREESEKLAEAKELAATGTIDSLTEAIDKAVEVGSQSYLYDKANGDIRKYSQQLLKSAEDILVEGDWQRALRIVRLIPGRAKLQLQTEDLAIIARAHAPAALDTVAGLKDAIAQVRKITKSRPFYLKSQRYIGNWQQAIADVATLERARKLAQTGEIQDLKAAVAKVTAIPVSNPRGSDAATEAQRWTRQIQEIEDMPYLETADQVASYGDVASLKEAISHAEKIGRNRALYPEAQARISEWLERSQRMEYQPVLDQAQQLASEGNLGQAIAVAKQVRPGVVLYSEAQNDISRWQTQLQDIQSLESARSTAEAGTTDAFGVAIQRASEVSLSSRWRSQADQLIDDWSQQLLQIGLDQSTYNLEQAIATLSKIPYGSSAYYTAQERIQDWEAWLSPPPVGSSEPAATTEYSDGDSYYDDSNYDDSSVDNSWPQWQEPVDDLRLNKPVTPDSKQQ